jgi:signal transduction histidine kinase/CheY-like chemotaxis protein
MMQGEYQLSLVVVSVLVAVLASYTALALAARVWHAEPALARWWIAGGAFAMGTGIWSMHFIGMLAFRLPIPLGYDLGITMLSWLLPIAVSAGALWLVTQRQVSRKLIVGSAVLMGLGINAMHYLGMAALRMQPGIRWDATLVAASIAIAIGASAAGLAMALKLRGGQGQVVRYRLVAAALMGAAIAGMHYTGMAAAEFPADSVCGAASGSFTATELALLVIMGTLGVLGMVLLTAVFDARLAARSQLLLASQQSAAERHRLLDVERNARAEAERLSELKDQFLATLSHELRTPLNAILGWVQILHRKSDPASVAKGLETIERNARLQARLIEDLLDVSRIVSGNVRLERQLVDMAKIVASAIDTLRPTAMARCIALQACLAADSVLVWGDSVRLQQIVWNLLANAIKFTQESGEVRLGLCRDGEHVVCTVSDNGPGIGAAFLPHVFERFRQADGSTTRRHGGLGLGLAIVRQLVELHGGAVTAHSDGVGRGASFRVCLPAAAVPADEALAQPLPADQALADRRAQLVGLKVLVVDDDADTRHLVKDLLSEYGAEVALAASADEALHALRAERPDVLVSDIGMPDVDGFELVQRVRSLPDPQLATVPALALSAFARERDALRARQVGFDGFVPKPLDALALLREIARLAARKA